MVVVKVQKIAFLLSDFADLLLDSFPFDDYISRLKLTSLLNAHSVHPFVIKNPSFQSFLSKSLCKS